MSTGNPLIAYGSWAMWCFSGTRVGSDPVVYHQRAPQLYDPVTQVAPFLVAAAAVPRPVTVSELEAATVLPTPNTPNRVTGPRYRTVAEYSKAPAVRLTEAPPCDPVTRFDALLWLYWAELSYGPYRASRKVRPNRTVDGRPANAAYVWSVVDNRDELLIGFAAFNADGSPSPYYTIDPCPPDDFGVLIRTGDNISAIAGL